MADEAQTPRKSRRTLTLTDRLERLHTAHQSALTELENRERRLTQQLEGVRAEVAAARAELARIGVAMEGLTVPPEKRTP
jgi:hypothetical protein